jgi:hypothetical protein
MIAADRPRPWLPALPRIGPPSRASIAYLLLALGWLLLCVSAHLVWSWPASLGLAGVGAIVVGAGQLWVATEPELAGEEVQRG